MLKLLAMSSQDNDFLSALYAQMPTPICEWGANPRLPDNFDWIRTITTDQLTQWVVFCSKKLACLPKNSKPWFEVQFKKAVMLKLAYENSENRDWLDNQRFKLGFFEHATIRTRLADTWVVEAKEVSGCIELDLTSSLGKGSFGAVNPGKLGKKEIAIKRIPLDTFVEVFSAFSEYMALEILGEGGSEKGANLVLSLGACVVGQGSQREAWLLMDRYPNTLSGYIERLNLEPVYLFFSELGIQLGKKNFKFDTSDLLQVRGFFYFSLNNSVGKAFSGVIETFKQRAGFLGVAYKLYQDMLIVIGDKSGKEEALSRMRCFFDASCSFEVSDKGLFPGFRRYLHFNAYQFGILDQVFLDIASSLRHIHAERFAFLDLKELNILMDSRNRAFLTDFGLTEFYNPDFYPLFAWDLACLGGTYRPPFVFGAVNDPYDLDSIHTSNVRALLKRTDQPCDLRVVDIFSFGVVIAAYFSRQNIGLDEVYSEINMKKWVENVSQTLILMKDSSAISIQKKFWIDIALECLNVSFDTTITMEDILKRVHDQNACIRHGAQLVLDGVIGQIEQQFA